MSNFTSSKKDMTLAWQLCLAFVMAAAVITLPNLSFAADTPVGNIYCILSSWATGNTGKGLATIAITVVGIGALLGKVSWGMALIVALGIAMVFGASGIVNAFGINGVATDCATDASWTGPAPAPAPSR